VILVQITLIELRVNYGADVAHFMHLVLFASACTGEPSGAKMQLLVVQNQRGYWQWIIKHSRGEHRSYREFSGKAVAMRDGKKMLKKFQIVKEA
jgi:hypothetical protein